MAALGTVDIGLTLTPAPSPNGGEGVFIFTTGAMRLLVDTKTDSPSPDRGGG